MRFLQQSARFVSFLQEVEPLAVLRGSMSQSAASTVSFSKAWQVLGPFQIGTREASWGADPLEHEGGFRSLNFDPTRRFYSSLAKDASVTWTSIDADNWEEGPSNAQASFTIGFPNSNHNWTFLQDVYGWPALQYQAWARGEITVPGDSPMSFRLYTDQVLEYWIDKIPYFGGDYYMYRRAPLNIVLEPGSHRIDVRLVRDVRSMGGIGGPTMSPTLQLNSTSGNLEKLGEMLVSDMVDGRLASSLASVSLSNTGTLPIEITDTSTQTKGANIYLIHSSVVLLAGQTKPVSLLLSLQGTNVTTVEFDFLYKSSNGTEAGKRLNVKGQLKSKSVYDPHKVVFMHPGGMASYAMLRPPAQNATCGSTTVAPILLQLHGAGVEAESDMVAHSLDPVSDICAWALFPTGSTAWSGDDWHNWGFSDVEAAVHSIPEWIKSTGWTGLGVDVNKWLVSGHSNGGQGTWYTLLHRPDKIIAAAPVSGYLSIQGYVPYHLWQPADPRKTAILEASLGSYKHELLVSNAKGIPVQQQHGGGDDNVPTYHSRLMNQRLFLAGWETPYNEIPDSPHYFDGVMTTDALKAFYAAHLSPPKQVQPNMTEFELVVANPGDTGSKGGIRITQLMEPSQFGKLTFSSDQESCSFELTTSNILEFEIQGSVCTPRISIDGAAIPVGANTGNGSKALRLGNDWQWQVVDPKQTSTSLGDRRGRQLGGLVAILKTQGPFRIIFSDESDAAFRVALQVSRNLYQYFAADSNIVTTSIPQETHSGNDIFVAIGDKLPESELDLFPIMLMPGGSGLSVRDASGRIRSYSPRDGLAAVFLRPLPDERLQVVVWGSSTEDLEKAARLVPMVTGVGQPDFIILGKSSAWKGVDGALAMGFFDSRWKVTGSSFFS
ncbi:hypothetical protein K402DRAFT_347524 [Aulographum hederae CBS 113979]|uniref:Peptidase S9 prolyl oligopeptidase catalytic domain-containing protein n=1 Tax=Aulographum hederae CBS 113979 TaxID=1176131 RepID=A0A6G1HC76_9PEZI|nr:hypothetical protein K402DRAFT_347524 [Aulographum hederae CBS 113979]